MIKLRKLDRRMNGFGEFSHGVEFLGQDKRQAFDQCRKELWQNFGAGREVTWWVSNDQLWAWDSREDGMRGHFSAGPKLYFRGPAATWIMLNLERFNRP